MEMTGGGVFANSRLPTTPGNGPAATWSGEPAGLGGPRSSVRRGPRARGRRGCGSAGETGPASGGPRRPTAAAEAAVTAGEDGEGGAESPDRRGRSPRVQPPPHEAPDLATDQGGHEDRQDEASERQDDLL